MSSAVEVEDKTESTMECQETPLREAQIENKTNDQVQVNSTPDKTQETRLFKDEMKFMKNFDPNERLMKKKRTKFTESGAIVEKCDCLIPKCAGCHFPCKSCGSRMCGHECRVGRSWDYKELEIQGYSYDLKRRAKN